MGESEVQRWVEGYIRAWRSNDPEDIRALFTDDARYFTAPHRDPWAGRDAIVEGWLHRKDEPGQWEFRWEPMAECDGLAFVRGWTDYSDPPKRYSNLWTIRLEDDGRASEFVEWWMEY
ncbi:MAG TPA: nuclear transport factor 2 family protein [Actinomycetota bacterium]